MDFWCITRLLKGIFFFIGMDVGFCFNITRDLVDFSLSNCKKIYLAKKKVRLFVMWCPFEKSKVSIVSVGVKYL